MKIAIIGAGISGASALKAIIDHPNFKEQDQIHLFEPSEKIGVGLPYRPDDESVMLNIAPESLSMIDDRPLDFVHWLEANYEEPRNFEELVSRPRYGKYLEERFKPYAKHPQVQHFQVRVEDLVVFDAQNQAMIYEQKGGPYQYRLKTERGWRKDSYDAVFLALGHPDYADYYNLRGVKNYIANPYPVREKLNNFSPQDKIGIIGSGATGVDLMRFFARNYTLEHPLTYFVQDQSFYFADIPYDQDDFQFSFSKDWIQKKKAQDSGTIPFQLILDTFINDLQVEGVDVKKVYQHYKKGDLTVIREAVETKDQKIALIHAYISRLIAFLPQLYNSLSGPDKIYYRENYYDKLIFFKSRVPYRTFQWLFELLDTGKIRIVHGLTAIQPLADGGFLASADHNEKVDYFINATGFDSRLLKASEQSPLIRQLFEKNIIIPHIDGRFVLVDWPQAQVINQNFGHMTNLFFFGLLIGGTQHENNDAQLTHQLAQRSARWFMDQRD